MSCLKGAFNDSMRHFYHTCYKKRIPIRYYLCFVGLVLVVIGVFPFIRKMGIYGDLYIRDMKGISTYPGFFSDTVI